MSKRWATPLPGVIIGCMLCGKSATCFASGDGSWCDDCSPQYMKDVIAYFDLPLWRRWFVDAHSMITHTRHPAA